MIAKEKLAAALSELFAPWVQALQLRVEAVDESSITLRLPQSDELSRVGGMLCGQAMMAATDTAMVLALMNHFGEFKPCTTVQMSSSFFEAPRKRGRMDDGATFAGRQVNGVR
jgi:acyl-coenzyme A thioesterase PaaI-like protein